MLKTLYAEQKKRHRFKAVFYTNVSILWHALLCSLRFPDRMPNSRIGKQLLLLKGCMMKYYSAITKNEVLDMI